jgi:hypothetical protein
LAAPHEITLRALQNDKGILTHALNVQNVGLGNLNPTAAESVAPGKPTSL